MLSPEEEALVLEAAVARGWLSRASLAPRGEDHGPAHASVAPPRFGARIDGLIARGDLESAAVENILQEGRQDQPLEVAANSGTPFPIANWERYELVRHIGEG